MVGRLVDRMVGRLEDRMVGRSVGRLVDRMVGRLEGRLVDRSVGRSEGLMVDRSEDRMVGQMVGWAPEHLAQPEVLALRVKSGLTGASGLSLERSRPQRIGGGRLQVVRIQPVERMLPVEASR